MLASLAFSMVAVGGTAHSQPARKLYRIGILSAGYSTADLVGPEPRAPTVVALLRGLRELGYRYGEHFITEPQAGEGKPERFAAVAVALIKKEVDLIVAAGPWLTALKEATSTIPIVMAGGEDPLGQGLVGSLAHPERNFTGLSNQSTELNRKRLELLKELVPGAVLVAVLIDPTGVPGWLAAEAAARERGWALLRLEVRSVAEIGVAIKTASTARAGALLVIGGGILFPNARQIAELAREHRLPAMYGNRQSVLTGGLISYGADLNDIWHRAAVFVDKIFKGAKAADLPVEQPTKFELVINLKAAKALGSTIPQSLLLRADEVIK